MFWKIRMFINALLVFWIGYCIYLSAFLVSRGEVHMSNDIGRDFLLLQELDQKKIVFIGARSNTAGVFHGPLWTYMNYPAYLIGHGNPVTIAWFWVLLGVVFLVTTFLLFRNIIGTFSSLLAVSLLAAELLLISNSIYGQLVGFYFMPLFIFSMYMYLQTKKARFLALHMVALGIFVQMNIGVGSLFAILSILLSVVIIIRNRLWKHFLALLVLPLCLINFILFDARHGFSMTKAMLNLGSSSKFLIPFASWVGNRFNYLIAMELPAPSGSLFFPLVFFVLITIFTIVEMKRKGPLRKLFFVFAFYYFGYMMLSYFNKGIILIDHIFSLGALSALWLATLTKGRYKAIFIPIMLFVVYVSLTQGRGYISYQQSLLGRSPDSWTSLKTVAQYVIDHQKGQEFGYFVYSPDAYAYQQRYGMIYAFQNADAKDFEYIKKPTTYIIVSPRPQGNPYMGQDWWIKNEAKITDVPVLTESFPSGYSVETFHLSSDEQKTPFDPNIMLGLHFR